MQIGDQSKQQQHQNGDEHAKCPRIVEPFAALHAANVQRRNPAQGNERERHEVSAIVCERTRLGASHKERATRGKVQHRREIWQVAHPVGPSGHEAREVSIARAGPHVKTTLLRITGRQFEYTRSKGQKEAQPREDPNQYRAWP